MRDRRRHVWAAIHICNVLLLATVTATPLYIPQFLSGGSGRNIRHLPCVSTRTGETGVCMFAFTCAKANGTHLGTCIDRFYFGSCCKIEQEPDDVFPQDNTIDERPLPPPKPLFTSTLSSIESNEIPPYFTKPKPILEKRPSLSSPSTQKIESTTSKILEEIATIPQKITSKKPIIYTTTESIGLSTFQTVQDGSTNDIQSRPAIGTSQPSTPSSTLGTAKPSTSGKPPSSKPSTSGKPSSTGKPSATTIGTIIPSKRPLLPPTFPSQASSSSYPSTSDSSSTFGSSPASSNYSSSPNFGSSNSSTSSGPPSTSDFASSTGSLSTSDSTSSSGSPSTYGSTSSVGSLNSGSSSTFTTSSLPSTAPPTFTLPQRPTIIDITSPPSKKNFTQTSETITASTKPVETTTKSPPLVSTSKIPATRFPPRNSTTSKPTRPVSSTTSRPSSTFVTKKPTVASTFDTKKPISVTVRPSTRPSSSSNSTKPASPRPTKPSKPTKPYPSSTKVPPASGKPTVTETIPFGGFKPTKEPTVDKIPTKTTTSKPAVTTTKTKTPVKPTKPSSPKPNSPKPSSPKPSSEKPSSPKPSSSKPSSVKPSSTTETTSSTTTIRSTSKPTTEKTKPSNATSSGITSTTPSTTSTTQEPTTPKSPIPTISTESNIYTPLNGSTLTNQVLPPKKPEDESAQTTYGPGLVTWTSSLDEATTYKIPEASSTSEEPTEWTPITTTDGWIIIQSPTTEKVETSPPSTPKPIVATTVPFFPTKPVTDIPTAGTFITTRPVIPTTLSSIATVTVSTESPQTIIPEINMSDYKQVCGRRLFPEGRIVGGNNSSFGRWPWQISLRQWRTSTYLHKCGAALLNENWAITAAHCVENVPPSDLLLRIGEYDLANESEPYGYQERRVQLVASHPQFDPRTFEYDLALLRFYEPIQPFQPNILPICLPDDDENFVGHTAYVTGWGRLYEDGPLPSVLQEVPVPVINNTVCESMYRTAGFIENIPHIFICAGWRKGGFDSCEGDSGGPMVIQRPRDKRWILAGIISWGIGCAEPNQPGVYTRISQFRDWINQILQF